MQHRHETERGDLAGNLRDPDWPSELVGASPARKQAADIGERPVDDEPGFLGAKPDGPDRIDLLGLDVTRSHRTAYAQNRLTGVIAKAVLALLERGGGGQGDRRAATIDLELQRTARIGADDP